jgi:hypothetical protein
MSGILRTIPVVVLALLAFINVGRGCIHAFTPDGGAHSIAGLDLTNDRQTVLALFAQLGLGQIVMGLFEGFVLVFRRDLVAIVLALQTADTVVGDANLYFYRVLPVHVPGAPFNAVLSVILVVALLIALTQRGSTVKTS